MRELQISQKTWENEATTAAQGLAEYEGCRKTAAVHFFLDQSSPKDSQRGGLGARNGAQGTPREAFRNEKLSKNQIFTVSGENFSEKMDLSLIHI